MGPWRVASRRHPPYLARMSWLPSLSTRSGSLRSQLLAGLAVLLFTALLAISAGLLVWLPFGWSPALMGSVLLVMVFGEVAVLLLFGDYLLRALFLEPLERMVQDAERIAEGDHEHRIEVESPDELRRLARSMNRMAGRLIDNQRMLAQNVRSLDETNRALTEARNELVQAEKLASVGRLAAGLAHEIGNPLNSVLAYADVARRRGAAEEWVEGLVHEANRIDRIVAGLLDYARPKSGPPTRVDAHEIVRETVRLLETQGRFKGIRVEVEDGGRIPTVRVNPDQLQQVLVNLLLNASDALEAGDGEWIGVSTALRAHRGEPGDGFVPRRKDDPEEVDYSHLRRFRSHPAEVPRPHFDEGQPLVVIEVRDDGPGVPEDQLERVFDPFFTTKEPGRGTGLGLAVSARLVYRMGGMIEAVNRAGGGTAFTVSLPADVDEDGEGG
ncbi:MAG TPA: ATP-binding protein [Gemmatimonadota bacterium]|nr:ATP-binding protein [Gemmatimonadota bacterium]